MKGIQLLHDWYLNLDGLLTLFFHMYHLNDFKIKLLFFKIIGWSRENTSAFSTKKKETCCIYGCL